MIKKNNKDKIYGNNFWKKVFKKQNLQITTF